MGDRLRARTDSKGKVFFRPDRLGWIYAENDNTGQLGWVPAWTYLDTSNTDQGRVCLICELRCTEAEFGRCPNRQAHRCPVVGHPECIGRHLVDCVRQRYLEQVGASLAEDETLETPTDTEAPWISREEQDDEEAEENPFEALMEGKDDDEN